MKKITSLIAMLAAGLAFTACEGTTGEDQVLPKFEKVTMEEKTDGTFFARFDVTCADTEKLDEVSATYTYGTSTVSVPAANLDITKGKAYEWTVKITTPVEVEGKRVTAINLTASVKGKNGGTKTESFTTPAAPSTETALSAAAAFEFKRVGATVSGDLSKFGLEWKSNTRAVNANITKGTATKMVTLASDAWTTITTKEALKTAVDAASDMTTFSEISADASKTYNINLGVVNAGVYYMLNITNGKVTTATSGTTIDITGNYKN